MMSDQDVQDNAENFCELPALLRMKQSQLPGFRKEKREATRKIQRKNLKNKARATERPRLVQRPIEGKRTDLSFVLAISETCVHLIHESKEVEGIRNRAYSPCIFPLFNLILHFKVGLLN